MADIAIYNPVTKEVDYIEREGPNHEYFVDCKCGEKAPYNPETGKYECTVCGWEEFSCRDMTGTDDEFEDDPEDYER